MASERVVITLLTEMNGLDKRKEVFIIAATNRPDIIDPAMLRPGRLDKCIYIPLPDAGDRIEILKAVSRRTPMAPDVDLQAIAEDSRCKGFSGADLEALVKEAAIFAMFENEDDNENFVLLPVAKKHFLMAFDKVQPSVSAENEKQYKLMKDTLCYTR